ncbi:MAG: hypothetical protein ACK4SA_20885 [Caldilinea sp.]
MLELSLDEIRIRQHLKGDSLIRSYDIEVILAPDIDASKLQVLADRFMGGFDPASSKESELERSQLEYC